MTRIFLLVTLSLVFRGVYDHYILRVTCGDKITLLVDGIKKLHDIGELNKEKQVIISECFQQIDIKCVVNNRKFGILASLEDEDANVLLVTDKSWKCSKSNTMGNNGKPQWDVTYDREGGLKDNTTRISKSAKWIRTDFNTTEEDETVYCRSPSTFRGKGLRWAPLNKPEFMSTGCGIPFHYPVTLKETIELDLTLDPGDVLSAWGWYRDNGGKKVALQISYDPGETKQLVMRLRYETGVDVIQSSVNTRFQDEKLSAIIESPFIVEVHCSENDVSFLVKYRDKDDIVAEQAGIIISGFPKTGREVKTVVLEVVKDDSGIKWTDLQKPEKISKEYTMKVMCDDVATIFVDGEEKQVAGTQSWDKLATVQIPSFTRAIGVQCRDGGGYYGIMVGVQDAAGEDVVVSDTSWKCTEPNVTRAVWSTGGFNEVNSWDEATELSSGLPATWQGMIPNAKIIWTNAGGERTVFCRKDLPRPLPGDLFWTMMKHITWSENAGKYLYGYSAGTAKYDSLLKAQSECVKRSECGGITYEAASKQFTLRKGVVLKDSSSSEISWVAISSDDGGGNILSLECGNSMMLYDQGTLPNSNSKPITVIKKICDEEGNPVIKGVMAVPVFSEAADWHEETVMSIKNAWDCTYNANKEQGDLVSAFTCKSTGGKNDCLPGTKHVINVVGRQSCVACDDIRRYQPDPGKAYCRICNGEVSQNATKCKTETCEKETVLSKYDETPYEFETTVAYSSASVDCTRGGKVYRYCNRGGRWSDKIHERCRTELTEKMENLERDLKSDVALSNEKATELAFSLQEILKSGTIPSARDVSDFLNTLTLMGRKLPTSNSTEFHSLRSAMTESLEFTLESDPKLMNDTDKRSINRMVETIALSLPEGSPMIKMDNIAIVALRPDKVIDLLQPEKTHNVQFDAGAEEGERVNVAVMSSTFRDFLPATDDNTTKVDSAIISINFVNQDSGSRNFSLIFHSNDRKNRTCMYLDSDTGHWETHGVRTVNNNDKTHTCVSDHATSFAIILSIEEIDEKQVKAQEGLANFMFAVNLTFLSLTFGLVAPFKKLRKKMLTMAQLNIIFALILGNVGFNILSLTTKVNVDYRNYPVASLNRGCVTGVLLVQYFFLSAMFWMGASAWSLYGKIADAVKNHGKNEKNFVRNRSILCWGGSALCPLAIYLAAWISNDRKDEYNSPYIGRNFTQGENCWVESPWRYPSFMVPTWLILLFNIFCFILVSRVIVHAAKTPNSETHQLTKIFKGMMAVSASVGLPWVIAAFTFDPFTTAAQYLFIIIVGLQGPLFFASMICLQDDVREHTIDLVGLRRFFKQKNKLHVQESTTENTTLGVSKVEPEVKHEIASEEVYIQRRVSSLQSMYNAIDEVAGPCLRDETETADTKDTTEGMPEIAGKEKTSQPKMDHDVNHTRGNAEADKKEGNEGYNENGENSTATYSGGQEVENDGKTNEECKDDNVGNKVERDNQDGKEKEAGQLEPEDKITDEKENINVGKTDIIYQNMEEPEQSSGDMTIDPSLVKSAYANV